MQADANVIQEILKRTNCFRRIPSVVTQVSIDCCSVLVSVGGSIGIQNVMSQYRLWFGNKFADSESFSSSLCILFAKSMASPVKNVLAMFA